MSIFAVEGRVVGYIRGAVWILPLNLLTMHLLDKMISTCIVAM